MAQSDFAEKIEVDGLEIEYTDVMTGDKNKSRFLYYQLKMSMLKASKIDIIVSFLMESKYLEECVPQDLYDLASIAIYHRLHLSDQVNRFYLKEEEK